MSPFFFYDYIHNTVVYSLSLWDSGTFLCELKECSLFPHSSAITVCFFAHWTTPRIAPAAPLAVRPPVSAESKGWGISCWKGQDGPLIYWRKKEQLLPPPLSPSICLCLPSHPHLPPQPNHTLCMEVKQSAARSHCCLHGLRVMLKSA